MYAATTTTTTTTTGTAVFERRELVVRNYCRGFDAVLATGRGSVVRDTVGREYLGFLAGAGALNYGHHDPDMKSALLKLRCQRRHRVRLDLFTEGQGQVPGCLRRAGAGTRERWIIGFSSPGRPGATRWKPH